MTSEMGTEPFGKFLLGKLLLGGALGLFGNGLYHRDYVFVSIAFIYLGLAWLYHLPWPLLSAPPAAEREP